MPILRIPSSIKKLIPKSTIQNLSRSRILPLVKMAMAKGWKYSIRRSLIVLSQTKRNELRKEQSKTGKKEERETTRERKQEGSKEKQAGV